MPKISTSTTIVVPAGQRLMIQGIGAQATATVNPGSLGQIYDVSANDQDFFGPFDRATTIAIQINGGSVQYTVSPDPKGFEDVVVDTSEGFTSIMGATGSVLGRKYTAPKFIADLEAARAGGSPLLIALLGDSNTAGTGAGTGTAGMVGAQRWSVGAQLADILDRTFMPTTNDAFFGDQNAGDTGVTLQQFDPRFSAFGAGWSLISGPTMGRRMFQGASGGAGALTFTPRKPWNRVRLLAGSATFSAPTANVKAGAATIGNFNTNTAGANTLKDETFSTGAAAAVQSFSLDGVSGGTCSLVGAIFWDSENPGCVVVPGGWCGGFASNLNEASQPWSPRPVAVALSAGLYITNATINDANAGTAIASFTASSLGFHQAVAAVGDVIVTGMTPSSTPNSTTLEAYKAALQSVEQSIDSAFPLIDWREQFGATYAAANAAGWMYDGNHLKGTGYARQANVYAEIIRSIALAV